MNTTADRLLISERIEEIHKALSKMIAINQMPISFCSSPGFKHFMNVVEPNYTPCSPQSESYITIICHTIDKQWIPKSFTLTTHEVDERHTAVNKARHLEKSLVEWDIEKKAIAIVTDNAANVISAVSQLELNDNMEKSGLTCAAHSLRLAVNKTLSDDEIQSILMKSSKIVGHFKHSSIAIKALEKMQQLNKPKLTLLQYCKTRWNSSFLMLERLYLNRTPIMNVLSDRTITVSSIARKLEMLESEWSVSIIISTSETIASSYYIFYSGELESFVSMVRPLIHTILTSHYEHAV
ncbi:uncharacterized protein LOC132919127 [Rhopalosiphum padi]|uniref:uncharacterized protein LOC132919127 n=1 Tax=Rhopalosiphum padi TaxID=40932 RepID=UPI00298E0A32|nr:uncharacterized protein LOC132919127 [Rhopalosiphum padi]